MFLLRTNIDFAQRSNDVGWIALSLRINADRFKPVDILDRPSHVSHEMRVDRNGATITVPTVCAAISDHAIG